MSSPYTSDALSTIDGTGGQRAVILAGGQGTRLKPYTTLFPKALVPLNDMPVLELVLRQLKFAGFDRITLAVGHLSELIRAYFGDGSAWGVSIDYAYERQPLGTAGPLKTLEDLPENFLVMNADIVCDLNFMSLYKAHVEASQSQGCLATIATYERTSRIDFGVLQIAQDSNIIENFIEKPTYTHSVSMGVYIFNRKIRDFIPENTFFGFDHLVNALIQEDNKTERGGQLQAYPFNGYWLDIGRVDDYEKAVNDFEVIRNHLLPPPLAMTSKTDSKFQAKPERHPAAELYPTSREVVSR